MICHALGENIKLLQEQAFEHWANAMSVNPNYAPGVFLKHIARMFWCRTQTMDFIRGSESIAKWLAELTARSFGRTIVYPEDYGFRLPFAMSIEEFASDFMTRVSAQSLDFLDSEATNKFSSETPPECIKTLVEVVSNKDASALRQLLNEHFNVFLHHNNDYDIGSTFDHISNHGYLDMMKCMLISHNGEFLINKEGSYAKRVGK
jgi:hypothetical protein